MAKLSNISFVLAANTSSFYSTSFPGSFPGLGAPSQEKDPGNEVAFHLERYLQGPSPEG